MREFPDPVIKSLACLPASGTYVVRAKPTENCDPHPNDLKIAKEKGAADTATPS